MLFELTNYLEWTGISDPYSKVTLISNYYIANRSAFPPATARNLHRKQIYVASKPAPFIDLICFVLVVMQMSKFVYSRPVASMMAKRATDACDGMPYVVGFLTFVRQHHEKVASLVLQRSSQYINSLIELGSSA